MTDDRLRLPQFAPSRREIDDIELLRLGALAPAEGFEGPDSDVTLVVPADVSVGALAAGELELTDRQGVPLARLSIVDTYAATDGNTGLIGPLHPLPDLVSRAFADLYVIPAQVRSELTGDTLTVAVEAPLTRDDVAEIKPVADGRPILCVVLAGEGTPKGLSAHGLIRATLAATARLARCRVIAAPAARRSVGDSHDFFERVVRSYAPGPDLLWPTGAGNLATSVQAIVDQEQPCERDRGLVVFFTGLSGCGKSTLAQALRDRVLEHGIRTVSLLDGDDVRRHLSAGLTFSVADRETNIERIGWVAAEIARHGGLAICSPIAPFARTRLAVRTMVENVGGEFILVHVSTPLEVCEQRDRKGLYAKARRGEIDQFTGISSPYEIPESADIVIDTTDRSVESALAGILARLNVNGLLGTDSDLSPRPTA